MQKTSFLVTVFLFLSFFSKSASADDFQNSCEFSFEKAVYSITQYCALNFYKGEIILTYGNAPMGDTASCTADRDIGPMGFEEADVLLSELTPKIFDESNNARMRSQLLFNENGNGLEARLTMVLDGDEQAGDLMIASDQISDGTFSIGASEFKLTSPQTASFQVEDALVFNLSGDCTGPYFNASDSPFEQQIQTCSDLGFNKGTEKHGECVLKLIDKS